MTRRNGSIHPSYFNHQISLANFTTIINNLFLNGKETQFMPEIHLKLKNHFKDCISVPVIAQCVVEMVSEHLLTSASYL